MAVKPYILEEKEYLVNLRRYFHAHPEVSLYEYETCKRIEEELDRLGIPHRRVGETGVYAWIDGRKDAEKRAEESSEKRAEGGSEKRAEESSEKSVEKSAEKSVEKSSESGAVGVEETGKTGRVVALRADMDALAMQDLKTVSYHSQNEGVCHACGHDGHTATLLTAAKVLKKKQLEFSGQIRLFFQQAEEIGQGARLFVKEGLLDGVDRVYGAHVSSALDSGTISLTKGPQNASCDYFKICVKGRGAHVSKPHLSIDAVYIASQIVVNLQSIVSRNTDPLETVVVGVGVIRSGTQYNIVAENAEIEGTTRCFSPEIRSITNERVTEIARQTAAMYGAECSVEFRDYAAPLVNDEEAVAEVTKIAEDIFPQGGIISDYEKSLGADDFADYLAVTKGMYAFVGTRNKENPNTGAAQHHGLFDLDEEALLLSCNLYVEYALWVLEH